MKLSKFLIWFLIFIFFLHGINTYFYLYWQIEWLDNVLHFLGGAWLALFMVWFSYFFGKAAVPKAPVFFVLLIIVGASALGGIIWEFFEFSFDQFVGKGIMDIGQLGVKDTMSDLFFDLLGGLAVGLIFVKKWGK